VERLDEAIDAHQRAGDLFRETGDRHGEGMSWNNLGLTLEQVGRFEEAIDAHQRDIAICDEFSDRYGKAQTLNDLGGVHAKLDQLERAREAWTEAVELYDGVGAMEEADQVRQQLADLDRSSREPHW